MPRTPWYPPALLLILSLAGCGEKVDHVACFPVTGQVLLGSDPVAGVMVNFYNSKNPGNVEAPQPYAVTDAGGKFSLSTFDKGDGAPADDYVVVLLWPDGPPGAGYPRDKFNNAYTDPSKTPFKATVKAGPTTLEPFKVDPAALKKPIPKSTTPSADPNVPG